MLPHQNALLVQIPEPAEIQQLQQNLPALIGDANIVWLEISMKEAPLMNGGQRRSELKSSRDGVSDTPVCPAHDSSRVRSRQKCLDHASNICIDMLVWVACEAKVYMQL